MRETVVSADPVSGPEPHEALGELRRMLSRRRLGGMSGGDLLYKAYVTVLLSLFGFYLALGLVDDAAIGVTEIDWVRSYGAAWVGLLVAMAIAAGMRSGINGGPLAVDETDFHHLLLSPLDRHVTLAAPVRRLTAAAAVLGIVAGAATGELASRRLPGSGIAWVASGILAGATITLGTIGAALLVGSFAALRRRPYLVSGAAIGLVAWSVVDIVWEVRSAPMTAVGRIGIWPMSFAPWALVAPAVTAVVLVAGFRRVGALSLDRMARRARLVRQVRFALADQDIRSLVLLRRNLGFERPRRRPMVTLRPGRIAERFPVWHRDLASYLRWPLSRLVRVGALTAVAGLSLAGVWRGTTALGIVVAVVMYLVALEAVEPFAQEIDHPVILGTVPVVEAEILVRHLVGASMVMAVVWMLAGVVAALAGAAPILAAVSAIAALPAAVVGAAGGALSIRRIGTTPGDALMMPAEVAGPRAVYRLVWPVVVAGAGVVPVVLVRNAIDRGDPGFPVAANAAVILSLVGAALVGWVRYRDFVAAAAAGGAATRGT